MILWAGAFFFHFYQLCRAREPQLFDKSNNQCKFVDLKSYFKSYLHYIFITLPCLGTQEYFNRGGGAVG